MPLRLNESTEAFETETQVSATLYKTAPCLCGPHASACDLKYCREPRKSTHFLVQGMTLLSTEPLLYGLQVCVLIEKRGTVMCVLCLKNVPSTSTSVRLTSEERQLVLKPWPV